jgi:hypothetical protein
MTMKKIFKYNALFAIAGAVALGATSCSGFLDVMPSGKLTEEEAFADTKLAALTVNGLYNKNISAMNGDRHLRTLIGTDELRVTYNRYLNNYEEKGFDDYSGGLSGSTTSLGSTWDAYWELVSESGKVINGLSGSEDETAKELLGEASFMRGLNMFKLSVLWGDIPIIDKSRQEEFGLARQPQNVVWQFIIDDFRRAVDNLPETQADVQRPTKYSALAMLGKSLMYAPEDTGLRDFAAADECFTEIIDSGRFGLVPNYNDLWNNAPFEYPEIPGTYPVVPTEIHTPDFSAPGGSESLFTVEFKYEGNDSFINVWQWCVGSWEFEAWFQGEKTWLSGYNFYLPTIFAYEDQNTEPDFLNNYEFPDPELGPQKVDRGTGLWEDGDLRREASIRYEWYYYTNQFTGQPTMSYGANNLDDYRSSDEAIENGTAPYMWIRVNERKTQLADNMRDEMNPKIKKFEDFRCDQFAGMGINSMFRTHKPFPVIRYADVLLLHAECLNEAGDLAGAIAVVDQVRARAWGDATAPAWTPGSQDEFRDMIMDERMRELAFEGWRRTDLIRTGKFVELVKTRNDWAAINQEVDENNIHWPIPIAEITQNADYGWTQNPGYN